MNAFFPSLLVLVSLALTGCIDERDPTMGSADDTGTDGGSDTDGGGSDTDGGDTDGGSSTPDESDAAYTYADGILTIDRDFNPYPGASIGFFADNGGTEDGWSRAVALVLQSEDGDIDVNLALFGEGTDVRWALAIVDENLMPTQWIWESGEVASNLVAADPLGLTMTVQECVGEEVVDKVDFCTQITSQGIMAGSCWGTYVPPSDCTDGDNDGDVDPDGDGDTDVDADGELDEDTDTDTDTECAGDCAVDDDGDGYSEAEGDCDDGWPGTNPGHSSEWEDNQDNDCDGLVDEDCESDDTWNQYCD